MLQLIVFSTFNGVLYGMLLFMMASGLTLIFSMMGVLNFAHASFYMLGAYFGFEISRRMGFWPGFIAAPLMVGAIGAVVERYGLRRVHKLGQVSELSSPAASRSSSKNWCRCSGESFQSITGRRLRSISSPSVCSTLPTPPIACSC